MHLRFPTNSFTILEPQDLKIGELFVVNESRAMDFEATKLYKGSSGIRAVNVVT